MPAYPWLQLDSTYFSTLLMVFDKTRGTLRHANVAGLHNFLVNEIKTIENRLRDLNLNPSRPGRRVI